MASFNKSDIDYEKLKQSASHYKGEGLYCSVIALAIATGCHFGKSRSIHAKLTNRKNGSGTTTHKIRPMYEKLGYALMPMSFTKGFSLKTATKRLPKTGTFLIYTSSHITCVRDGVNHDWSATSKKTKNMQYVYEVLKMA